MVKGPGHECQVTTEREDIMAILKFKGIGQVDKRLCRVCGCTQFHACPGGCYWVTDDQCSKCFHDRFKPMTSGHPGPLFIIKSLMKLERKFYKKRLPIKINSLFKIILKDNL